MFYQNPSSLPGEVAVLDREIQAFRAGELSADELKARRVPFGCYEQRRDGTYMVRVRTTGGAITPVQLRQLAETAGAVGSPFLHITTRQEFQLHDLALDDVTTAMRSVMAAGLSTRGGGGNAVRNITVSPEAGLFEDEVFDPSPYAFALTTRLIGQPDSWTLPRKLKIAFSHAQTDTAFARFNDLGFIACRKDGQPGFRVYVAGGMGARPAIGHLLHDFVPVEDVYAVTEAIKRLFDKRGNRRNRHAARLRFLWTELGEDAFRAAYQEELDALRREGPQPLGIDLSVPSEVAADAQRDEISDPAYRRWRARFVQDQRQPGLASVLLPVTLGNVDPAFALDLARFLEPIGADTVRAAFGQSLRLRNIPVARLPDVWALVKNSDPLVNRPRFMGTANACTGADTCKLGICRPKGALVAITEALDHSGLPLDDVGDFRLNLSGCPNSCGQHMLADLGFFGGAGRADGKAFPTYVVVAGGVVDADGARFATQIGRVPARRLPDFVPAFFKAWLAVRDRYATVADWIADGGADTLKAVCAPFAEPPSAADDPAFYRDWGSETDFSMADRGAGECAADLFGMIATDLAEARTLRDRYRAAPDAALLAEIALRTARALLVTRGAEVKTAPGVFDAFETLFIDTGLVDERFRAVVRAARGGGADGLAAQADGLFDLLDTVGVLYDGLDGSLRFR